MLTSSTHLDDRLVIRPRNKLGKQTLLETGKKVKNEKAKGVQPFAAS